MNATQSTWTVRSHSSEQTQSLGQAIARLARESDVIALIGELGAGKTQLVRGLAEGLGIDPRQVASPTFVLMHEYSNPKGGPVLVHIDAYRLTGLADLETIGWEPGGEWTKGAIAAIEWADRLGGALGQNYLEIRLEHHDTQTRELTFTAHGHWLERCNALRNATNSSSSPKQPITHCPTCPTEVQPDSPFFPFCSKRCKLADLGRWFKGDYRITRPIEQRDLEEGD